MDNFWDSLLAGYTKDASDPMSQHLRSSEREASQVTNAIEYRLSSKSLQGGSFQSVRALTESERAKKVLQLPVEAGVRVSFTNDTSALLTYTDAPSANMMGTVISVKSASGDITSHEGRVFVRWEDGVTRQIFSDHLMLASGTNRRAATNHRVKVASLGDLTEFLKLGSDTLVHKATRDLWRLSQDGDGYNIERLFDDNGSPLKV